MQMMLPPPSAAVVPDALHAPARPRRISRFTEDLVRPPVTQLDLVAAYQEMAADEEAEAEALEWAEATIGDVGDAPW